MKTAFSYNNKIHKQNDSVSMGSSLGPVLANITMTELEKIVVSDLIKSSLIKFYITYADNALLLAKEDRIDNIIQQFNAFDNNLKFTIDKFEDSMFIFWILKLTVIKEDHTRRTIY